jgi:hypothetical protein
MTKGLLVLNRQPLGSIYASSSSPLPAWFGGVYLTVRLVMVAVATASRSGGAEGSDFFFSIKARIASRAFPTFFSSVFTMSPF